MVVYELARTVLGLGDNVAADSTALRAAVLAAFSSEDCVGETSYQLYQRHSDYQFDNAVYHFAIADLLLCIVTQFSFFLSFSFHFQLDIPPFLCVFPLV